MEYIIKKSVSAKSASIKIGKNGLITVVLPRFVPESFGHQIVKNKQSWINKKLTEFKMAQVGDPRLHNYSRDQYLKYKEVARSFCNEIVSKWANKTGVSYNRIAIKDMKTRWGSCSSKSNLNFNYKIIFLNDAQADYLIVHEVSHLIELNHSSDFWALVEMQIPNYKKLRKEISKLI